MNLRTAVDEYVIQAGFEPDLPCPYVLPRELALPYLASTEPGSLESARDVLAWLIRSMDWADTCHYAGTGLTLSRALRDEGRLLTGSCYAASAHTLAALELPPRTTGLPRPVEILADARDREDAGLLQRGHGLLITWVDGLPDPIPAGFHLRAMMDAGGAATATAVRVLTGSRRSIEDVEALLR